MRPVNILHLSDLHFTPADRNGHFWNGETASDRFNFLETLINDLRLQSLKVDIVVITGDMLDKYDPGGVPLAVQFLGALRDALKLTTRRVIIVPGNHDVCRDSPPPPDRYEHFRAIWNAYYNGTPSLPVGHDYDLAVIHDFTEELGIQLVGFNSCEHHSLDPASRYHGHISRKQRDIVQGTLVSGASLRIALLHHHLTRPMGAARADYSEIYDSATVIQWLAENRFRLVFHGHQHVDWHETRVVGDWAVTVAAGGSAGVAEYGRPHDIALAYQVITADSECTGNRKRRLFSSRLGRWEAAPMLTESEGMFLMGHVLAAKTELNPKDVWPTIGLFRALELANTHVEHFHFYSSSARCSCLGDLEKVFSETHLAILMTSRIFSDEESVDCNVLVAERNADASYELRAHRHKTIKPPLPKMSLLRNPATKKWKTLPSKCGVASFVIWNAEAGNMGAAVVEDVLASGNVLFYKREDGPISSEMLTSGHGPIGAYVAERSVDVFRHAPGHHPSEAGFRSLLAAPIMRVTRSDTPPPGFPGLSSYGVLNVTSASPRLFNDVHVAWVEVLAGLLGALYSSYEVARRRFPSREKRNGTRLPRRPDKRFTKGR